MILMDLHINTLEKLVPYKYIEYIGLKERAEF